MLEKGTGKPCYPMLRGVNTELFHPLRRQCADDTFVLGYVGRLATKKNIRFLVDFERALLQAGAGKFRFSIVGQGAELPWLKAEMQHADFAGVLRGPQLAQAYANMEVFVFPSRTDTYGNVVLEAQGSFVAHVRELQTHPELLRIMRKAAREHALRTSWDAVFESVYTQYRQCLRTCGAETFADTTSPPMTSAPRRSRRMIW